MLQFLTGDLMEGYGLPKKRMVVRDDLNPSLMWRLSGTVAKFDARIAFDLPADVIAIGRESDGFVYSLHSDGLIRLIGVNVSPQTVDVRDLHSYLDD